MIDIHKLERKKYKRNKVNAIKKVKSLKRQSKKKLHENKKFTGGLNYVFYYIFFKIFDYDKTKYREMVHCVGYKTKPGYILYI